MPLTSYTVDELTDRFSRDMAVSRRAERDAEMEDDEASADPSQPRLVSLDFHALENAALHHCARYEVAKRGDCVVVRRGATADLTLTLTQPCDLRNKQEVKLYFSFGHRPNVELGTLGVLEVGGGDAPHHDWGMTLEGEEGCKARLKVQIPSDAPVGVWRVAVQVMARGQPGARQTRRLDTHVYILFNPWSEYDGVYLPEDEHREEYVLSDVGKVFVGSFPHTRGRHWVFGQFDDAVLPACVLLLDRSGLSAQHRGDPVRVARVLSKMVNSNDDTGLLVGRWDGEYGDGAAPASWTGSIQILEQYLRTRQSVKYGQCWVFAAVTNTICRALGMPCRVVTNFASAHDTNVSLSIDEFFDEDGDEIEVNDRHVNPAGIHDSIWNFHVWNDVWMARPDLPDGFSGWQAIDATPQETSDGAYQCGPASLEAVKQGRVDLKYDVAFVLAEVNADVVRWQKDDAAPGGFKKVNANKSNVGRLVLTKKPGAVGSGGFFDSDRDDVTWDYKPPEGTRAERVALHSAARRTRNARAVFDMPETAKEDVLFSIEDRDQVPIGENFNITITMKNTSSEQRSVSVVMTAASVYYTGAKAHTIKRMEGEVVLMPGESKSESLDVYYSDYYTKLVDHDLIKGVAICTVKETSSCWAGSDKLEVVKPDINVEVMGDAVMNRPIPVRFSFENPLPIALRSGKLVVDGPGLLRPKTIPIASVAPKAKMQFDMKISPKRPGVTTLVATFNCPQLYHLTGSRKVVVAAN